MTILNTTFDTLYQSAPFSKIDNDDYLPAFIQAIKEAKAEIDEITNNSETPTFENTIEALDFSGEQLDLISSIFFNLNSAETNDTIQKIAQEVSPLLSEFSNDITLNETLFKRVKAVYDIKDTLDLNTEQNTLLDKKYKGFSRNGANLSEDKKTRLREIDKVSSQLKLKFGENVLAETNAFEMHLTNEEDLAGLPEGAKEAAQQLAESKQKEGWLITLDYPSYIPFMTYAENRELRKKLAIAFGKKVERDMRKKLNIHPDDQSALSVRNMAEANKFVSILMFALYLIIGFIGSGTLIAGIIGISNITVSYTHLTLPTIYSV